MTISSLGLFTEVSPNFGLLVGECVYVFRKLTIKYRPWKVECMYIYIYICMYIYMYVYKYKYIHIYIHIYMYNILLYFFILHFCLVVSTISVRMYVHILLKIEASKTIYASSWSFSSSLVFVVSTRIFWSFSECELIFEEVPVDLADIFDTCI